MELPVRCIPYILLLFDLFQKAITLKCQSPQYVDIGEKGILHCFFPTNFTSIVWYDSVNITNALVTKIEKQNTGKFKLSGDGYEGRSYDIFLNGSLIIPSVTRYHDRTFKVTLTDENLMVTATEVVVVTITDGDHEESAQGFPTAVLVIIILIAFAILGIIVWTYIRRRKLMANEEVANSPTDDPTSQPMIEGPIDDPPASQSEVKSTIIETENEETRTVELNEDEKGGGTHEGKEGRAKKTYRSTWGSAVSKVTELDHDDELVNSIDEIEYGDHIILSSWLLHPRCHAIVVDKNEEKNELLVIRFTFSKGVQEEWLPLKPPTYRVNTYYFRDKELKSNCCRIDEVIARARSLKGKNKLNYSITKNTGKTFARWCKTGVAPDGRFGYEKSTSEI